MKIPKVAIPERLKAMAPRVSWPQLGRTVDVPVYLVHNSLDEEDYYFIFDFEEFVEASRSGSFVRPRIKVWAGRKDFSRTKFAREFRLSFAKEFEAARNALNAQNQKGGGWFSWLDGLDIFSVNLTSFVANVVLLVALNAGRLALSALPRPGFMKSANEKQKLESEIEKTKVKVDAALEAMTITIHMDLFRHAYRHGGAKGLMDVARDAWPLPEFVLRELQ